MVSRSFTRGASGPNYSISNSDEDLSLEAPPAAPAFTFGGGAPAADKAAAPAGAAAGTFTFGGGAAAPAAAAGGPTFTFGAAAAAAAPLAAPPQVAPAQEQAPAEAVPRPRGKRGGRRAGGGAAAGRWWLDPPTLAQRVQHDLQLPSTPTYGSPLAHSAIHPDIVPKKGTSWAKAKCISTAVYYQLKEIQQGERKADKYLLETQLSEYAEFFEADGYADLVLNLCHFIDLAYHAGDYPHLDRPTSRVDMHEHYEAYSEAKEQAAAQRATRAVEAEAYRRAQWSEMQAANHYLTRRHPGPAPACGGGAPAHAASPGPGGGSAGSGTHEPDPDDESSDGYSDGLYADDYYQ